MSNKVIQGTEDNFVEEVLKPVPYVLVYVVAEWWNLCKEEDIIVEQIAKEYGDQIKVVKFDIEKCPNIQKFLNVDNIPMFMVYKRGKQIHNVSGAYPIEQIRNIVEKAMCGDYHVEDYKNFKIDMRCHTRENL